MTTIIADVPTEFENYLSARLKRKARGIHHYYKLRIDDLRRTYEEKINILEEEIRKANQEHNTKAIQLSQNLENSRESSSEFSLEITTFEPTYQSINQTTNQPNTQQTIQPTQPTIQPTNQTNTEKKESLFEFREEDHCEDISEMSKESYFSYIDFEEIISAERTHYNTCKEMWVAIMEDGPSPVKDFCEEDESVTLHDYEEYEKAMLYHISRTVIQYLPYETIQQLAYSIAEHVLKKFYPHIERNIYFIMNFQNKLENLYKIIDKKFQKDLISDGPGKRIKNKYNHPKKHHNKKKKKKKH